MVCNEARLARLFVLERRRSDVRRSQARRPRPLDSPEVGHAETDRPRIEMLPLVSHQRLCQALRLSGDPNDGPHLPPKGPECTFLQALPPPLGSPRRTARVFHRRTWGPDPPCATPTAVLASNRSTTLSSLPARNVPAPAAPSPCAGTADASTTAGSERPPGAGFGPPAGLISVTQNRHSYISSAYQSRREKWCCRIRLTLWFIAVMPLTC